MSVLDNEIKELKVKLHSFKSKHREFLDKKVSCENKIEKLRTEIEKSEKNIKKARLEIHNLENNYDNNKTKYIQEQKLMSKKNNFKAKSEAFIDNKNKLAQNEKMLSMYENRVKYCSDKLDRIYEELDVKINKLNQFNSNDMWFSEQFSKKTVKVVEKKIFKSKEQEKKEDKDIKGENKWWRTKDNIVPVKIRKKTW